MIGRTQAVNPGEKDVPIPYHEGDILRYVRIQVDGQKIINIAYRKFSQYYFAHGVSPP
jgi:hypothetical protein